MLRALDAPRAVGEDPVRFARAQKDPRDREAAAFLAAALAFGNVRAIGASVARLLEALGAHPAEGAIEVARGARRLPQSLVHRWLDARELHALCAALGRVLDRHGTLEACFRAGWDDAHEDIGAALSTFCATLIGPKRGPGRRSPLFPSPAHGSACKRPCLFLRWMVRPEDGIDLGLWRAPTPEKLIMPIDVHVARVARRMGLLQRKTLDWKAALELTAALRRIDPRDPVRFDFAMVHVDRLG